MLQLKMLTQVNDARTLILMKDNTGNYNSTSNPGGWGGSNYPKATTNLTLIRYQVVGEAASSWIELGGQRQIDLYNGLEIALTPQDFGIAAGLPFANGEYIIEWMVLFDYPLPAQPTEQVLVNGNEGSKAIVLDGDSGVNDLRLILQPRGGVYTIGQPTSLNLIDMSQSYTNINAQLISALDVDLLEYPLYSVGSVSAMLSIVDNVTKCVLDSISKVAVNGCGCSDGCGDMDEVVTMTILKFGMDVNQSCGNLQAAEDIRKALLSMCDCKCGCS